jgi:hypothetical protein
MTATAAGVVPRGVAGPRISGVVAGIRFTYRARRNLASRVAGASVVARDRPHLFVGRLTLVIVLRSTTKDCHHAQEQNPSCPHCATSTRERIGGPLLPKPMG